MTRRRLKFEDLKRRKPLRTPNKAELIVCEGSSTEPQYFNELKWKLRLPAVHIVEVLGLKDESEPICIVKHAISKDKEGTRFGVPYSNIWCVFDVEVPRHHRSLDEAIVKARSNKNINIILSNPSFEYWLLLHFQKVLTPFHSDKNLQRALKKCHPAYKKSQIGFGSLYSRIEDAIRNSKQVLHENGWGEDLRNCNPATHVHKVVEHLLEIH